jgi:hypothetical protein
MLRLRLLRELRRPEPIEALSASGYQQVCALAVESR